MPAEAPTSPSRRGAGARREVRRFTNHPHAALIAILTCQLMVVLDSTIVTIALPKIQSSLHFSHTNLSWVVNAYTLAFGGLLLLGARIGDVWGRRRTLILGISIFTLASFAGGLAQNEAWLLIARALQGVGGALAAPSALALLMTNFPGDRERTRALGFYAAVSVGGGTIGLLAGGMLTGWVSWRWVMFVNVPIGLLLLPLARLSLRETPTHPGRFDISGALTSTIGMTSLVYGFVRVGSDGWSDTVAILAFALGVALLAAFVLIESHAELPITPLRLFSSRNRNASHLSRMLLIGGSQGMFFFLAQFLQEIRGYSAVITGLVFLPMTAMVFGASQLTARKLVELIPRKSLMLAGLACSAIGLFWLAQIDVHSGFSSIFGPMLVFGLGNGLAFVPLTSAALQDVAHEDSGAASGLMSVAQQVGGSLGLAVLVTVFGTASRGAHSPAGTSLADAAKQAFTVGVTHAITTSSIFLGLAFVATALMVRTPKPPAVGTPVDAPEELLAQPSTSSA
jgi:EmrB/QacA subfamily drug resistance transporter